MTELIKKIDTYKKQVIDKVRKLVSDSKLELNVSSENQSYIDFFIKELLAIRLYLFDSYINFEIIDYKTGRNIYWFTSNQPVYNIELGTSKLVRMIEYYLRIITTDKKFIVLKADITEIICTATVNSINETLQKGVGIDGSIHWVAGSQLKAELAQYTSCLPGESIVTKGYSMPAEYIIHTVPPRWKGGENHEEDILKKCYLSIFEESIKLGVKTLSIPSLATGAFGFPLNLGAQIAVLSAVENMKLSDMKVVFIVYKDSDYSIYKTTFTKMGLLNDVDL